MAIHVYIKEIQSVKRQVVYMLSYVSLVIGALLLFWSFYPIISFEIYARLFIQQDIISPIPLSGTVSSLQAADSLRGNYNIFSNNLRDFTQANLWFPTSVKSTTDKKISVKDYYITIPKINISEAHVVVGGEDLAKSLVHYVPTSLPGEYGNVAIFGHSTLPQLYNVKDYKTIFTYLPSLEKGDQVLVKMPDATYEYEVFDMFVVNPDQVSVLEQKYDASYLTLVTCVPPGTWWKRLVVRAKLSKLPTTL